MKRRFYAIGLCILLIFSLVLSSAAFYFPFSFLFSRKTGSTAKTPSAPTMPDASAASQILTSVNTYRSQNHLAPVVLSSALSSGAQKKADDLHDANYFSHVSPTYGSAFDMMRQQGIRYSYAGENIAKGYASSSAVMGGWMNSPSHKANILSPHFTTLGVGYVKNGGYWVQWFIG